MAVPNAQAYHYQRHEPEKTTLYKLVQANWLTFQQQVEQDLGYPLPDFVIKEFDEYLRCGILAHGFLRAQCTSCHHEMLVAFSCKKRGFCPSCGARRMMDRILVFCSARAPFKTDFEKTGCYQTYFLFIFAFIKN